MTRDDDRYVVGVDYGTLSGRALVVRVSDGAEMGSAVLEYPHGVVDSVMPGSGRRLPPDWALQVPSDYVEVLRTAVPAAVDAAGVDPGDVIGIATDFTACTMVPTLGDGTPLCDTDELRDEPHAYVKLWKHHAAQGQADRITDLARERGEGWLARYGGVISSEWEFAKGLQLLEEAPEVYAAMEHWVEAADWIVWQLTDRYVRNACTAGYKGIRQDGTYPSRDYLAALNPAFEGFVEDKLDHEIGELGAVAGHLSARAAAWTGLPEGIPVAVGNVDAHVSAPAADAVAPGQMVAIMGTSTCHVMSSDVLAEVPGMCGVVDGGIVTGLYGYEAGQSGVGDIFGWFVANQVPASYAKDARAAGVDVHEHLTALAAEQPIGAHGLVALDWWSGNRSVLVDHDLSGLVVGMTLTTRPEDVYRALLESTAFGARVIVETFAASGVPVTEFIVTGGLQKNALLMQIYADVLDMPLSVVTSTQGPALGSALHAAVAAGAYADVPTAAKAMGRREQARLHPDPRERRRLRAAVCRVPRAPRPLRSGCERRHAHAQDHPAGGPRVTATTPMSDAVRVTVDRLRAEVADLHGELTRYGLVIWTAGNVSARVPGADLMVIKPSGVSYDDLTADTIVVTDLHGSLVEGERAPSSDTAAHAYVYRHLPDVGGVVHTHSTYATAWAARREPIPCVLTMVADEFGGEVPVGPFALIGDDSIGRGIVETLRGSRSRAVLMAGHGPFTVGRDARDAVKAAVMLEDVARTVHVARQLGEPQPLDPADVDALFDRYQNVYGQQGDLQ